MQEGGVHARAVRAAHSHAVARFAEEVLRADVLEGEVAARLDLEHLGSAEQVAERADQRDGSPTICARAFTHWTCEESRWLLGPPWTDACHGIPSSANSVSAEGRTSGNKV
jgi:hypothetical protein